LANCWSRFMAGTYETGKSSTPTSVISSGAHPRLVAVTAAAVIH
jgi:hypothetical protein